MAWYPALQGSAATPIEPLAGQALVPAPCAPHVPRGALKSRALNRKRGEERQANADEHAGAHERTMLRAPADPASGTPGWVAYSALHCGQEAATPASPHHTTTRMGTLSRIALGAAATLALAGCGIPSQTTRILDGPEPVTVRLEPAVPAAGQFADLTVESPSADSIVFESENGLDRYWSRDGTLRVRLAPDFGDSVPAGRYAVRWHGPSGPLSQAGADPGLPAGSCRDDLHEIAIRLPEENHRTVAVTAGYNTVFARRSLLGSHRTVALPGGPQQRHLVGTGGVGRTTAGAPASRGSRAGRTGASFDLSRVVKRAGQLSYGSRSTWTRTEANGSRRARARCSRTAPPGAPASVRASCCVGSPPSDLSSACTAMGCRCCSSSAPGSGSTAILPRSGCR